ncbi:MAG: DUF4123 domain-containing protein [Pseudomonadota bacterium]
MNLDFEVFQNMAREDPSLKWYAIVDNAQCEKLPDLLGAGPRQIRCLLDAPLDSPLAQLCPHLVELCSPDNVDSGWVWIRLHGASTPCVSIIATCKTFDTLFTQLANCTQISLPDGDTMFFAFWDSAVLGTLMGQADDQTLHVPGPVLDRGQQTMLADGIAKWWYWDRNGGIHSFAVRSSPDLAAAHSLELDQQQVDDLVEASVPDHLLYYLSLNQSALINDFSPSERYHIVRGALAKARDIGLVSMRDLVNYVCVELIYKERLSEDRYIADLLAKVKASQLSFHDALELLP